MGYVRRTHAEEDVVLERLESESTKYRILLLVESGERVSLRVLRSKRAEFTFVLVALIKRLEISLF